MKKAFFTHFNMLLLSGFLAVGNVHAVTATSAMMAEVQAALDKGDAQHAVNLADAALKETGNSAGERGGLFLNRGLAYELLGRQQNALADFTAALSIRMLLPEEREQALLQRGFLLDSLNRLNDAAADYTAVIGLRGVSVATALNNRANILRRQGRAVEARRDYLAALSRGNARSQYSYYGLGQLAETKGDREAARGFYAKAVDADPGYALASERLAALGGSPDGFVSADSGIVLRPPSVRARAAARPAPVAERIVLRPPRSRPAAGIGLRPALDAGTGAVAGEVQLGAWRSEAEAQAGWKSAVGRAGGALDTLAPHIVVADLPGRGRYYRLRTRPRVKPAQFCVTLTVAGLACLPARD
jgi:tetratricopeptide (TPR) repeat protein